MQKIEDKGMGRNIWSRICLCFPVSFCSFPRTTRVIKNDIVFGKTTEHNANFVKHHRHNQHYYYPCSSKKTWNHYRKLIIENYPVFKNKIRWSRLSYFIFFKYKAKIILKYVNQKSEVQNKFIGLNYMIWQYFQKVSRLLILVKK
jgi:hypothetical protein